MDLSRGGQVPYLLRVRSSKLKVKGNLGVFGRGKVKDRERDWEKLLSFFQAEGETAVLWRS